MYTITTDIVDPASGEIIAEAGDVSECETVGPDEYCPVCHESRMDYLVWQDDETIRCETCGCEYDLEAE